MAEVEALPDITVISAIIIVLAAVVASILLFRRRLDTQSTQKPDTQRFAKLLVAEIKLYNQQEVESARKAGNIYQQLKSEIDRARKMYDDRIAFDGTLRTDYFYEELAKDLAGGDETKLGPGIYKRGM